jgi:2-amino-4-hydroxy-6-hydroxymethyldihydropteridine diphosphokinase
MSERDVVFGLGSNLGSREAFLRAAVDLLGREPGIQVSSRSPIWETDPVGPPQPRYLNAAIRVRTSLGPEALLARALEAERSMGRERIARWGARTIDIDLLWIDGVVMQTPTLSVPHPELTRRGFALVPLVAIVPDARDLRSNEPLAPQATKLGEPGRSAPFADRFATEVLEHTADEGFVVWARDRADALAAAAEALGGLIVAPERVAIEATIPLQVELDANAPDDERFFAWLSEVHYHLDARRFALRRAVVQRDDAQGVAGLLFGEPLDEARHTVHGALKAVTYHALEAGEDSVRGYRAQVIVDV